MSSIAIIESESVAEFWSEVDLILTFNQNPDHVKYAAFYQSFGCDRATLSALVFSRRGTLVISTVGVKEFLFGIISLLMGWRVIHIIHDWEPHPGKKRTVTKIYNRCSAAVFHLAFHSRSQATAFGGSCSLVPLPVTCFFGSERQSKPCENARPVILTFGRNEPYKNYDFLCDLSKDPKFSRFDFRLISKGYKIPSKCGSANLTVVSTFVTDQELRDALLKADLAILPYSSATQSGVIIDCYEAGLPVVVSRTGGLPEYVDDDAVFDLDSRESIVDILDAKLSSPPRFDEAFGETWNRTRVL